MKKTSFIFLVFVLMLSTAVYAQTLNCKQYRNGTFKVTQYKKTTLMKRLGATETDYLPGSKVPYIYRVKWLNDCTYTLKPTKETLKQHPELKKNILLTFEIAVQNTNSFTEIVSANYTRAKTNIEVTKIK